MTSKKVKYDELVEMRELSKSIIIDKKTLRDNDDKVRELEKEVKKIKSESKEINVKYKNSYGGQINLLDKFGILTYVKGKEDYYECRFEYLDGDTAKIYFYDNHNHWKREREISIVELQTKGFLTDLDTDGNILGYIVDDIVDVNSIINMYMTFFKKEARRSIIDRDYYQESIQKLNVKLTEIENRLKGFSEVSDNEFKRMYNTTHFGITEIKVEEILKNLPRVVEIYKEKTDER